MSLLVRRWAPANCCGVRAGAIWGGGVDGGASGSVFGLDASASAGGRGRGSTGLTAGGAVGAGVTDGGGVSSASSAEEGGAVGSGIGPGEGGNVTEGGAAFTMFLWHAESDSEAERRATKVSVRSFI